MKRRNLFLEKRIFLSLKKRGHLSSKEYQYLRVIILGMLKSKLSRYLPGFAYPEDLMHSAIEILIVKIKAGAFQFDESKGLLAYVNTTLANLIVKEKRFMQRLDSGLEYAYGSTHCNIYGQLAKEELLGLMKEIFSKKAYCLMQLYLAGYDNHEIAKELGYKNAATVANKKYQYREKLKAAMGSMAA